MYKDIALLNITTIVISPFRYFDAPLVPCLLYFRYLSDNSISNEGTWRWIYDYSTVYYASWGVEEPSNHDGNENCAEMWEAASYR